MSIKGDHIVAELYKARAYR